MWITSEQNTDSNPCLKQTCLFYLYGGSEENRDQPCRSSFSSWGSNRSNANSLVPSRSTSTLLL